MIGCMSFLVADLVGPDKGLNGWYQLLDEEKGSKENQPVPVSISRQEGLRHLAVNQRPGPSEIAVSSSHTHARTHARTHAHTWITIFHRKCRQSNLNSQNTKIMYHLIQLFPILVLQQDDYKQINHK